MYYTGEKDERWTHKPEFRSVTSTTRLDFNLLYTHHTNFRSKFHHFTIAACFICVYLTTDKIQRCVFVLWTQLSTQNGKLFANLFDFYHLSMRDCRLVTSKSKKSKSSKSVSICTPAQGRLNPWMSWLWSWEAWASRRPSLSSPHTSNKKVERWSFRTLSKWCWYIPVRRICPERWWMRLRLRILMVEALCPPNNCGTCCRIGVSVCHRRKLIGSSARRTCRTIRWSSMRSLSRLRVLLCRITTKHCEYFL